MKQLQKTAITTIATLSSEVRSKNKYERGVVFAAVFTDSL